MRYPQDLEFRPVTLSDGDQFIFLLNKTYARKKTIEYYKWQFLESPLRNVLMGAFLNEKLVGCFGLQCHKLNNGLIAGQAIDLIVHEKFRRQGIFIKLGEVATNYFDNSLDFCFSLPNALGRRALDALDYKTVMAINTFVLTKLKKKSNCDSERIIETWDNPTIENNKKLLGKGLYFIREIDELKWRFAENPSYTYSIIRCDENTFAIVKIFVDPITQEHFGDIVDFGFNAKDINTLEKLFCSATNYLINKGVKNVTCWGSSYNLLRILNKIGFVQTGQERYFCVKCFEPDHEYLYNSSNWFLVEADAEIY